MVFTMTRSKESKAGNSEATRIMSQFLECELSKTSVVDVSAVLLAAADENAETAAENNAVSEDIEDSSDNGSQVENDDWAVERAIDAWFLLSELMKEYHLEGCGKFDEHVLYNELADNWMTFSEEEVGALFCEEASDDGLSNGSPGCLHEVEKEDGAVTPVEKTRRSICAIM